MPPGIRLLLGAGVAFTLVGLLGLAVTLEGTVAPVVRWLLVLCYAVGALCLIAAGLWWAIRWTRRRDQ